MSGGEITLTVIVFAAAAVLMIFSILHFMQRGFLFNNAYIYASKEERETMDKEPHYRQSAIVFCLLSIIFIIIGISLILHNHKLQLLEIPFAAGTVIYAIVSSVKINKSTNNNQ